MAQLSPQHQWCVAEGDLGQCYKPGRKIADGFRLLVDGGLGWEQRTAEATTLEWAEVTDARDALESILEQI